MNDAEIAAKVAHLETVHAEIGLRAGEAARVLRELLALRKAARELLRADEHFDYVHAAYDPLDEDADDQAQAVADAACRVGAAREAVEALTR